MAGGIKLPIMSSEPMSSFASPDLYFTLCDVTLTEAYRRPFSFMAKYLPENRPLMATTPTSTAVISKIPGKDERNICLHTNTIEIRQKAFHI